MSHQSRHFDARIRARGYRLTPQRQIILDAICAGGGHTTLEEIYERVQRQAPSVNRSTLYRTLDFLRALNLVVAAEIGGRTVFEIAREEPHHHLVCCRCGTEIEIGSDLLAPAFAAVEQRYGFAANSDHLVIRGVCALCRGADGD